MDLVDIRLIRALRIRAFAGPARAPADLRPRKLAEAAGLSRETVRQRLLRLRDEGVLLGFHLMPNLRLLGAATTTYHLVVPPGNEKEATLRAWRDSHDVTGVFDFVGRDLCVEVTHPPGGAPTGEPAVVMDSDGHPEPRGEPTSLGWRLLRTLRHDALCPVEDAAADVGCSARTARRLLRDLADRRHADVVAVVDPSAIEGLLPGLFAVRAGDPAAVLRAFGDHRLSSWVSPEGTLWIAAFAATPAGLTKLGDVARACPGVRGVDALVPGRVHADPAWIDGLLATKG